MNGRRARPAPCPADPLSPMLRAVFPILLAALLAGCATAPPAPAPDDLFHDELFGAPRERVGAEDIFAVSEPMRRFVREEIAQQMRARGPQQALVAALLNQAQLKLEYDSTLTRTASEAFAARAGNCLSLVIMTSAFAKELGLRVRYQSAYLEETWNRQGSLLMRSGHVNIALEPRVGDANLNRYSSSPTIDFLPPEEVRGMRTVEIDERRVVAMFMNNRAVEAMVQDRDNDAYAWAREAIRHDPSFSGAQNTLGIVYLRIGALAQAGRLFERVLRDQPQNTQALANLAETMSRQGRQAEAIALREKLARIEESAPFHYFKLGIAAMRRGEFQEARQLFAKEVARAEFNAEFQYWLGMAYYQLGERGQAARHLALARQYSTTKADRESYSSKLAWLKSRAMQ